MAKIASDDGLTAQQRYRLTDQYKATRDARTKSEDGRLKARAATKKWRLENKEKIAATKATEEFKNKRKEYYQKKKVDPVFVEEKNARKKDYYEKNKDSILLKMRDQYKEADKEKYLIKSKMRRSQLSFATPLWANKNEMKLIYANRGFLHVDHIIPIRGRNVSGLHCAANLQYLDGASNKSKLNKFNQDSLPSIAESMAFDAPLCYVAFYAATQGLI